ncbi:MAG: DUF819 family protein [Pseudomonadota bacterium]
MPLIGGEDTFALLAVLTGIVVFSIWAETTKLGRVLSAILVVIVLAMLLSNTGVIPYEADLYKTISSNVVAIAIPMLLFRADLRRVIRDSGPTLIAFFIAVFATLVAVFAANWLVTIPEDEPKIVSMLAAMFVGGTVNFVATSEAVQLNNPSLYVATWTADIAGTIIFIAVLAMLPAVGMLRALLPSKYIAADGSAAELGDSEAAQAVEDEASKPFDLFGLALGLAVSLAICAVSKWISTALGMSNMFMLIITVIALLVANFAKPLVARIHHDFEVGTFFMYLFFAALGTGAKFFEILGPALPIFIFILVLMFVHIALLLFIGKLLKRDLAELLIASNACILGPATAAALAASRGWRPLVVPGVLIGIFSYSLGTFVGVGVYNFLT